MTELLLGAVCGIPIGIAWIAYRERRNHRRFIEAWNAFAPEHMRKDES